MPVAGVLKSAIELCQTRADDRGVKLCLSCASELTAVMHAGLMEQAVVNLIDNAIKYGAGAESARVDIEAVKEGVRGAHHGARLWPRDRAQTLGPAFRALLPGR